MYAVAASVVLAPSVAAVDGAVDGAVDAAVDGPAVLGELDFELLPHAAETKPNKAMRPMPTREARDRTKFPLVVSRVGPCQRMQ